MTMLAGEQSVFIIGSPRSGTSWLQRMMEAPDVVIKLGTELSFLKYLAVWDARYREQAAWLSQGKIMRGLPDLYTADEFFPGLHLLAQHAYAKVIGTDPQGTHIIEKHPGYTEHLPFIERMRPGAKYIHLIRDGREVVVSMMSAAKRGGSEPKEIVGASRQWATYVQLARQHGSAIGAERYLEVRYEELVADPVAKLTEIFRFVGLPVEGVDRIVETHDRSKREFSRANTEVNTIRDIPDAIWKTQLTLKERWSLDRIAGHLLQELGYGQPGWWALHLTDRIRMAPYPAVKKALNALGSAKHILNTPFLPPAAATK